MYLHATKLQYKKDDERPQSCAIHSYVLCYFKEPFLLNLRADGPPYG